MHHPERSIDGLWLGLTASIVLHVLAVPAVMRLGDRPYSAAENVWHKDVSQASEPPLTPEERVRLGLERSDRVTINWIGFADPTAHKAMPSELEQAALSLAPMGDLAKAPQAPMPAELVEQTAESADPAGSSSIEPRGDEQPGPLLPAPNPDLTLDDPWRAVEPGVFEFEFLPPPSSVQPASVQPEPGRGRQRRPDDPAPASEQPHVLSKDADPGGADDLPGMLSDKQSPPAAREIALSLTDWGKPAAGEGIEITPRRPRWGATIYSLAWPRNPVVVIEFGREGFVRRASFAVKDGKPQNTGSAEVDRVLLNTIYNWTAKGEKIESLTREGPGSRLTIRMNIKLRW